MELLPQAILVISPGRQEVINTLFQPAVAMALKYVAYPKKCPTEYPAIPCNPNTELLLDHGRVIQPLLIVAENLKVQSMV